MSEALFGGADNNVSTIQPDPDSVWRMFEQQFRFRSHLNTRPISKGEYAVVGSDRMNDLLGFDAFARVDRNILSIHRAIHCAIVGFQYGIDTSRLQCTSDQYSSD